MRSKLHLSIACLLAVMVVLPLSSCEKKKFEIDGSTYEVQCYWVGGPNDFSPRVTFQAGGVVSHVDDTATVTGTWNAVEEVITWELNNPPNRTEFRGTFDKDGVEGNFEDQLGNTGRFQGIRK